MNTRIKLREGILKITGLSHWGWEHTLGPSSSPGTVTEQLSTTNVAKSVAPRDELMVTAPEAANVSPLKLA